MWDGRTRIVLASITAALALLVAGVLFRAYRSAPPVTPTFNLGNTANSQDTTDRLNQPQRVRDDERLMDMRTILGALGAYRNANGTYPVTLQQAVPDFLTAVPRDPLTGEPYLYTPLGQGPDYYTVTYALEHGTQGVNAGLHRATPNGVATP